MGNGISIFYERKSQQEDGDQHHILAPLAYDVTHLGRSKKENKSRRDAKPQRKIRKKDCY